MVSSKRAEINHLSYVLTSKKAQELLNLGASTVKVISNGVVFWFTDDYCMGVNNKLPPQFVPSSTVIPCTVTPRASLPSGEVVDVKDYINIFCKGEKQIESFDELIEYLNKTYPDFAD